MNILGIETSCDETAAAIVQNGTLLLSSVVATSHQFHSQFGGVLPELASRKQLEFMIPTLIEATNNYSLDTVDAIAVTVGPGLIGSLLMGVECAKTLAMITKKPIIPVNHVHAHIYANFLISKNVKNTNITFPAIALVVSGGHTELFFMKSKEQLQWLGGTIDDAAGEAFDKSARLLGLGNAGGKAIQEKAQLYKNIENKLFTLPRPLIHDDTYRFSFSGLKTAIQREWTNYNKQPFADTTLSQALFAYEIQEAITDVLVKKTLKAAEQLNVQTILLGGGVSANTRLQEKFIEQVNKTNMDVFFPDSEFCTDNAASIASYAFFHFSPQNYREISASPTLSVEKF